jgi:hypothetical protein
MTHKAKTLRLLRRGWLTALQSAQAGGVLSLSQRCGEFQREGMTVLSKWVETPGGARIKAYRIVWPKGTA